MGLENAEIRIHKLGVEDAALLSKVAIKAYSDHYLHLWLDGGKWYINKYFSVENLTDELKNDNSLFFIVSYNTYPVGFLKINISNPLPEVEENALELERIYITEEASGKGIGRELVNLAMEVAYENRKKVVWLKAMDTSSGPIAFYKKMGFEVVGTHVLRHQLMKEELRGMVIMVRNLIAG